MVVMSKEFCFLVSLLIEQHFGQDVDAIQHSLDFDQIRNSFLLKQ